MQHGKGLDHNRSADNNIIARQPADSRGDEENLLALPRYDQGRSSTPWTLGEESARSTSKEPKALRKLLDINGLVAMYGLKRWTVRSYCSMRRIPFIKLGRRVFFDPEAIDAWIKAHERPVKEVQMP
jgi:hypothetical protein